MSLDFGAFCWEGMQKFSLINKLEITYRVLLHGCRTNTPDGVLAVHMHS